MLTKAQADFRDGIVGRDQHGGDDVGARVFFHLAISFCGSRLPREALPNLLDA